MLTLNAENHHLINKAASVIKPHRRGVFLIHVRTALANGSDLSQAGLVHVLLDVLGHLACAVGPSYFRSEPPPHHAGERIKGVAARAACLTCPSPRTVGVRTIHGFVLGTVKAAHSHARVSAHTR